MSGWAATQIGNFARKVGSQLDLSEQSGERQFIGRSTFGLTTLAVMSLLGATGMLASAFGMLTVLQLAPGLKPFTFDATVCLTLGGVGLLVRRTTRTTTIILGGVVSGLALFTIGEYLIGKPFGVIPTVSLLDVPGQAGFPGRMSPGTALCFLLGGLAISFSSVRLPPRVRPAMLELVALLLFVAALEGALEQTLVADVDRIWPLFSGMSVQTSIGLMCLSLSLADMSWTTRRLSGVAPAADWVLTISFVSATMFDILSPVGVIGGIAYLPVIFLAARSGSTSLTLWTAATATVFALLGFFWSPQDPATLQYSAFNRLGEIAAIWTVAILLCRVSRRTEALQKSDQRYTLAVEAAKVGLWDRRLDGTENYWWSPVTYRLLGHKPGEVVPSRRAFAERLHPDDRWSVKTAYLEHLIRRTPYEVELRLRHRTLGYRWYLCAGQAVWSRTGRPVRMTGTLVDIEERKRAERQRSETEWVATVSHELRTPMTSCLGALAIAKSGRYGELPEAVTKLLDLAHTNGTRLVSLVDDLLTAQKLSAGHFEMKLDVVSVHDLIRTAIQGVVGPATARRVRIDTNLCVGNPQVRVDPDRLVQVIVNFLSNGIKYGPEGGVVGVETDWSNNTLRISVRDNGPGIPENDRHRIFEKFFRVESESHRQVGGNGLGLSICKSIVDGLGGTIGFDSPEGEGATFWVEFPVVTWTPAEKPQVSKPRRAEDEIAIHAHGSEF